MSEIKLPDLAHYTDAQLLDLNATVADCMAKNTVREFAGDWIKLALHVHRELTARGL